MPITSMTSAVAAAMADFAMPLSSQAEPHVLLDRHVRENRITLKHHRRVALVGRHVVDHLAAAPIQISPSVGASKPAIMRSVVVLPQPEGPSSVTNSPSAISRFMSLTASAMPPGRSGSGNSFRMSTRRTLMDAPQKCSMLPPKRPYWALSARRIRLIAAPTMATRMTE